MGIIIDGKLVALDTLENLTREQNIEDAFFALYEKTARGSI